MSQLFSNLLTASFHGSIVIVAVLILRLFLKNAPKKFLCLLWLLAGLRLLMPFEIQSDFSLQPEPEPIVYQISEQMPEFLPPANQSMEMDWRNISRENQTPIPEIPYVEATVEEVVSPVETVTIHPVSPSLDWEALIPWVWLGVASLFLVYTMVSYVSLRIRVREAIRIPGGWECDRIETAFILGFLKPRIYIPMGLNPIVRKYILAHERTHLEKGDHWFKMIGFIALALHWFNPLVWVAYILLCKDIEMACDERVIQFMELPERKEYSAALLSCSTNRIHFAACPVAFGEVSVKERVLSVLNYKKPSFWISLLGVLAIAFVALCLVTSPTDSDDAIVSAQPGEGQLVSVTTVDELLAAIAPDTTIVLAPGTYNLTDASDYGGSAKDYYSWGQVYDGYELILEGVTNLTIRGSGKLSTTLETDPRYAEILLAQNCDQLTLEGFTAGHTAARGECSGGVIELLGTNNVTMKDLGIFGCGVVGLYTQLCTNVTVTDSDIYDCSSSAFYFDTSMNMTISGCRIYRIGIENYGGYTFLETYACQNVLVENNEFNDSTLQNLMNLNGSAVTIRGNLFRNVRPQNCAFALNSQSVVLDANKFEDCAIRSWYNSHGSSAYDGQHNLLTEEKLNELYFPEQASAEAPKQLSVHVSTVEEFLAAIAPNREIILDGELYDLSKASEYGTGSGDYYYWEDVFDGPGLVIRNVENLTIRGNSGDLTAHNITAVPRYADVLQFKACKNITLSGFTAGHTIEPGSCAGNVLEFHDSDQVTVDYCGLFGCGVVGIQAEYCSDIQILGCDIYECSYQGIQLRECRKINIEGCTFRDLGDANISLVACENARIDGQTIIPENEILTYVAKTSEQKDQQQLEEALRCFGNGYLENDPELMKEYLSKSYEGEPEVYPYPEQGPFLMYFEVTPEQRNAADAAGKYTFSIPFREDWEADSFTYLTMEVVREDDRWVIAGYALEK